MMSTQLTRHVDGASTTVSKWALAALVLSTALTGCGRDEAPGPAGTAAPQATVTKTAPAHTPTGPASAVKPVLGAQWSPNVTGYGKVKPNTVDGGGSSSGRVDNIHWDAWGGSKATGTGTALYVAPDQATAEGKSESAKIVAWDLGPCPGHSESAYRKLAWYFPAHGETSQSAQSSFNACTGDAP